MIRPFFLSLCALLAACSPEVSPARGEARIKLFHECMTAAAQMPRQADDDVSDIVAACSNQAYYMTNYVP